jgi:hypothetical protein
MPRGFYRAGVLIDICDNGVNLDRQDLDRHNQERYNLGHHNLDRYNMDKPILSFSSGCTLR